jgi:NhaP-type Na+/H+ or K+/H+ antiporter
MSDVTSHPINQVFLIADAVTVVLYSMMVVFAQMEGNVSGGQYALGIVSFFTISLGGLGIGILCGLLTALITRTTSEVRGTDCSHSRAVIYQ